MDAHLKVRALCALTREMGMGHTADTDEDVPLRDTYLTQVMHTMAVFNNVTEDDPEVVEMSNDLLQMALCMNLDTLRKTVVELVTVRLALLDSLGAAIRKGELRYVDR